MSSQQIVNDAQTLADQAVTFAQDLTTLAANVANYDSAVSHGGSFFMMGLTIFMLACFVGYYVVSRVTPALHAPLMAITNAISSVVIVGAIIAASPADFGFASLLGLLAIGLASVNIFGGFLITQRMLALFKKGKPKSSS